jgi:hypothetical protein
MTCMQRIVLGAAALAFGLCADPADGAPKDLVLIHTGTLPIVLTAPHGGRLEIPDVPVRGAPAPGEGAAPNCYEPRGRGFESCQPRHKSFNGLDACGAKPFFFCATSRESSVSQLFTTRRSVVRSHVSWTLLHRGVL